MPSVASVNGMTQQDAAPTAARMLPAEAMPLPARAAAPVCVSAGRAKCCRIGWVEAMVLASLVRSINTLDPVVPTDSSRTTTQFREAHDGRCPGDHADRCVVRTRRREHRDHSVLRAHRAADRAAAQPRWLPPLWDG